MLNQNFDKEMEKIISGLGGGKPTLLLHACCAPCSTACLERLKAHFDMTVYFYNPNMDTLEEFKKRAKEEIRLCKEYNIPTVVENYDSEEFFSKIRGLESQPEGGKRCEKCFNLRLNKTAEYAKRNKFEYFTTTLTLSPLKNATLLNEIGYCIGEKNGVKFLPSDFKKKGGYQLSIELSKKYSLYRQNYCGCVFSKR